MTIFLTIYLIIAIRFWIYICNPGETIWVRVKSIGVALCWIVLVVMAFIVMFKREENHI